MSKRMRKSNRRMSYETLVRHMSKCVGVSVKEFIKETTPDRFEDYIYEIYVRIGISGLIIDDAYVVRMIDKYKERRKMI